MRLGRRALCVLFVVALLGPAVASAKDVDPCQDTASPEYGSHACKVARLRERPFVVVAAIDSGVNPYHRDFRLPADDDRVDVHPSEYIEGFPATPPLQLTLDVPSPASGRNRDSAAWASMKPMEPRWVPGTNIIGVGEGSGDFFDGQSGHGTGVSSVIGGLEHGRGPKDVVLVAIRGGSASWLWASQQPWIDVMSISWSAFATVLNSSSRASRGGAASGKISCVASGNLHAPIIFFEEQGPSTSVHVGAVDPDDDVMKDYSGWPNDVLGYTDLTAAAHNSTTATRTFGGTSAATPHVCALIAKTIWDARRRLDDTREGPHGGGLAVGTPAAGPAGDGVVDRREIEDAMQSLGRHVAPDTTTGRPWVRQGYGLVSAESQQAAVEVLFGERPRPARPDEDAWQEKVDFVRDAVWGNDPFGG